MKESTTGSQENIPFSKTTLTRIRIFFRHKILRNLSGCLLEKQTIILRTLARQIEEVGTIKEVWEKSKIPRAQLAKTPQVHPNMWLSDRSFCFMIVRIQKTRGWQKGQQSKMTPYPHCFPIHQKPASKDIKIKCYNRNNPGMIMNWQNLFMGTIFI